MNNTWETQYIGLVKDILLSGNDRVDRTGTGTRALFGRNLDIDLSNGFPAVTTKKLAWKAVVSELLWFLEGSQDERRLCEILHGTRDESKKTIWTENAKADYWKPKAKFNGDLGSVYGAQWRGWNQTTISDLNDFTEHDDGSRTYHKVKAKVQKIDQIARVIKLIKTNPADRRMIISAFNVAEFDQMALPPCHIISQFFVENGRLSCSMLMRSCDVILGLPFNIASYALLTHMIAQVTELKVGRLVINLNDVHIYKNHLEGAELQINRSLFCAPTLDVNKAITNIDGFSMTDFGLKDYQHHEAITLKMAV